MKVGSASADHDAGDSIESYQRDLDNDETYCDFTGSNPIVPFAALDASVSTNVIPFLFDGAVFRGGRPSTGSGRTGLFMAWPYRIGISLRNVG